MCIYIYNSYDTTTDNYCAIPLHNTLQSFIHIYIADATQTVLEIKSHLFLTSIKKQCLINLIHRHNGESAE